MTMENLFVNVINDVHICGACQSQFSLIASFVAHVKVCPKRLATAAPLDVNTSPPIGHPAPSQTPVLHIPEEPLTDEEKCEQSPALRSSAVQPVTSSPASLPLAVNTVTDLGSDAASSLQSPLLPSSKEVVKFKKVIVMGMSKYRCTYELCAFTTRYLKDLNRHYRIHTGERPYHCWQCGKHYSRKDKLKIHQMSHKGEKPFKCLECDYATNDNSSLVKHRRVHTGERPYKCQICPYASRNSSQLVVHLRTHTGDAPFHCRQCHMKFKINSDLKRHSRLHTGEKPYACEFCDFRCSIKGNLNAHMKSHISEAPISCELCEYVSLTRKDLRAHERLHQTREYQCPQCAYAASSQAILNVHIRIHSHEKPYKCQYCSFTSRQSCNIHSHIKKKHPDKLSTSSKLRKKGPGKGKNQGDQLKSTKPSCRKMFKCKVCKSGFVRIDSLRCHLRQHQAEQLLAKAAQANAENKDSENSSVATQPESNNDVILSSNPSSVNAVTAPQQTFVTNNLRPVSSENSFANINVTNNSQLCAASGVNLVLTTTGPTMSTPPLQTDYNCRRNNVVKQPFTKPGTDDYTDISATASSDLSQAINAQSINTIISSASSTPISNDLGLYQVYQMPANVSFVTLPVVPSASTHNSFSNNMLAGLGELDASSLVNPSSTLLHISGIGPNVQYVISPAPAKINADVGL